MVIYSTLHGLWYRCGKLEVAPVMGPATATVAEPVLFLQPTYAGAQEPETNGSWASAGAFCAGAVVAAGAVAYAAETPTRREQRAAKHAARVAAPAVTARAAAPKMTATMEAPAKAADVKELYAADPAAAQKEAGTLESAKLQERCKCHIGFLANFPLPPKTTKFRPM